MLSLLNAEFEKNPFECQLDPSLWDEWLWSCDLHESVTVDCLLNRAHLIGLLIARYKALRNAPIDICVSIPHMVYTGTRVLSMTPRQLQDTVQDLQMHWHRYTSECDTDVLIEMVDACMARFGHFCLYPGIYDDVGMRDATQSDRMSVLCMRRFLSIFCVMYRHLDLLQRATEPQEVAAERGVEKIMDYHVQASMEEFHKHMMHSELPPAARLIYRQDFTGFYHCVSQVVYFHYPSYERKPQLTDLNRMHSHPLYALAPLREMYPEFALYYEDETPAQCGTWYWMLMGKRIYLMNANRVVHFRADGNLSKLLATVALPLPKE